MMFGAGNVVFPVLLGDFAGEHTLIAIIGFLFAGIVVPFLGLVAVMYYGGDYLAFFGRLGKHIGFWIFALLIALVGPIGSIPRLLTISYATLKPYLPEMPFVVYSLLACILIFLFVLKKSRVLGILAYVLTPILLVSLAIIIIRGITTPTAGIITDHTSRQSFLYGLELGYSLLDLVAAFLYGTLILGHIKRHTTTRSQMIHVTLWSTLIAMILLSLAYIGLTYVGTFHAKTVNEFGPPEQILRAVSLSFLGPWGGIIACIAVGLACLTTAISLTIVCENFLEKEVLKGRSRQGAAIFLTLAISFAISNLGFTSISRMIGPILNILTPSLIILCLANIAYKLYQFKPVKTPVYFTLILTVVFYLVEYLK